LTKYLTGLLHHLVLILFVLPVGLGALLINLLPMAQAGGSPQAANLGVAATQTAYGYQYLTPAQNASDTLTQITETDTVQKDMTAGLESSDVWQSGREWMDTLGAYVTDLKVDVTSGAW
jgi:hypothetical protein